VGESTVHRTIRLLQKVVEDLNVDIPLSELERIGVMINRAMSAQERSFHTPEHIFDLASPEDPYITLAALFHDIVYFQVDQGFSPDIDKLIAPYIVIKNSNISLIENVNVNDRAFWGCLCVFGFKVGQLLSPFNGMNEFLSALVMNLLLEGLVADKDLLITTACIEQTIPFRKIDEKGNTPSMLLERNLINTCNQFSLKLTKSEIEYAVKSAVTVANRDVWNFCEEDVALFLDITWKLLPETNPSLRMKGSYTINNYCLALKKMEAFLYFLDPLTVFSSYKGTPPDEELQRMTVLAERNITMARKYLGIKLLASAVLTSLADISGGDAPMELFMGDMKIDSCNGQISDLLPEVKENPSVTIDQDLFNLLTFGRASASSFDLQNSPLSLFIYRQIGTDGLSENLILAKKMFEKSITNREFLLLLPRKVMKGIVAAGMEMAFTRKEILNAFLQELSD
jgi:hypothetical protein